MRKVGMLLVLFFFSNMVCSWNAVGHRLVVQIAYNNMSKEAKRVCNQYNRALNISFKPLSLVKAGPWMDGLRYMNKLWLQDFHYIDLPFTRDGSQLIPPVNENAVSALNNAMNVLSNRNATQYDKGFSLRILLHVVGDIHQPMHAVSEFSTQFPQGDYGGNLFKLASNSVGSNLHAYWDNGGGMLKRSLNSLELKKRALAIEANWPCDSASMNVNPEVWAEESHQLAVSKAYLAKAGEKPSKAYKNMVKAIAEKRIALAGCRLAAVLNRLA